MDPTLKTRVVSELKAGFPNYSPRMKAVAKYIVDNPADFGLDPVRETARKIGVSTYTLVRTAQHLGFQSFDELREPFRHALVSTTEFVDQPEWIEEMRGRSPLGDVQAEAAMNALSIVQRSLQRQSPEEIERLVSLCYEARNVFVTAVRASYAIAHYLNYVGRMALPSIQLVPRGMSSAIDELNEAGAEDVLIAITVAPYSRETIEACLFAQSRGVKVVLISDSDVIAPGLAPEIVVLCSAVSTHRFGCFSGTMAVIEVLVSALFAQGGEDARVRIESYEALRDAHSAYWVSPKKKL